MIKVSLRGLFSHKLRLLLTIAAVAVSVAFMAGTQILTATVSASFDKVFDDVYKNIDVVVRSTNQVDTGFGAFRDSISEDVVPTVAGVPGVTAAEGQVQGQIAILDKNGDRIGNPQGGPPTFGLNWLTEPELNGWKLFEGRPPATADEVVLDKKTADTAGYKVGDKIKIQTNQKVSELTITGLAGFGTTQNYAGSSAALFTTPRAQELVVEPGKFTWINVAGQEGVTQERLAADIQRALPAKTQAITGKAFTAESQDVFRRIFDFLGIALLIFGIVALVVGAFIIYNTFSIIVAQRTRELALLRAMGASRRQILGSVTLEALLVGLFASLVGIVLGIGLATLLTAALSSTGGGLGEDGLTYKPSAFIISIVVGTVVTLVSGFFPAWRASRVPPVAAMRDVAVDTGGRTRVRAVVGGLFLVLGLLVLYLGLFSADNLQLVGLGIAMVFLGVIIVGPLFAKPMSRIIGAPVRFAFTGRLAGENAMRNPRRTAATASALMIGVGLIVTFAILIQSIKTTVNNALDSAFTADLIVDSQANPGQPALPLDSLKAIAAVPGVASAGGIEGGFGTIDGSPSQVLGTDLATLPQFLKISAVSGDLAKLGPDEIAVPKKRAEDKGWKVGTRLPSNFLASGQGPVTIGAIYEVEGVSTGIGTLMSTEGFDKRMTAPFKTFNQIYVKVAPGANPADVQAALKPVVKAISPSAAVQNASEFASSQTGFLDILLLVVSVLLVLAIIIAILGIINTLLLSVYERTRELGLLRAVGMKRGQTRAMVMWESVIFALQGTAIGVVIGFVFGSALVKAIAAQLEGVSFTVPWGLLVGMVIAAIVGGIGAGLLPAFSASRLKVLDAISSE